MGGTHLNKPVIKKIEGGMENIMIVTKPEIKKSLSESERINFIQDLADSYFLENQDGDVEYVPYLTDRAFEICFYLYCVNGIEFEYVQDENGNEKLEDILGAVSKHLDVKGIYNKYISNTYKSCPILIEQLDEIKEQVKDIVDFRKQMLIHQDRTLDKIVKIVEALSPVLDMLKEVDFSKIDWKVVEEIFLASLLRVNGNENVSANGE